MSRRVLVVVLAGLLVLPLALACAPAPAAAPAAPAATSAPAAAPTQAPSAADAAPADLGKVRLAVASSSFGQFAALLAVRKGFFEEDGLEVEIVEMSSGPDVTAAAVSGAVEFAAGEAREIVRLAEIQQQPIKGIVVAAIGDGFYMAISKEWADAHGLTESSSIDEKLGSLAGAEVAISRPGSSGTLRTQAIIRNRGVADEDVTLVPTGGGAASLAAFEAGRADAFAWTPPFPQQAQRDLGAILVNYEEIPELSGQIGSFHFTTEQMIAEQPEVVQAYVNGIARAFKFLRDNKEESLEEARQQFSELDEETLELSFDAYYGFLTNAIEPTEESWTNSIAVYNMVSPEEDRLPEVPLSRIYDPTFAQNAEQELGIE